MLEVIKNDLFNIAKRIREIDDGYFIVYNKKKSRFEVHNSKQAKSTLCIIVPYERLDIRTLELVRKTSVTRIDELMNEMEKSNNRLEMEKDRVQREERMDKIERIVKGGTLC